MIKRGFRSFLLLSATLRGMRIFQHIYGSQSVDNWRIQVCQEVEGARTLPPEFMSCTL